MSNKKPAVFVFCALACEAKPLIDAWKLSRQTSLHAFATYSNSTHTVVVSGIGKAAMAGAVGYTLSRFAECPAPILINFGIAGHATQPCGSAYLVNKLTDSETGRRFYPQLAFCSPCPTSSLISCPRPEIEYKADGLYDMEASAFYEIAMRFSSCELSHCLKVVSDNRQNPVADFREIDAVNLCSRQVATLDRLIDQLQQLRQSLAIAEMDQYQQILAELHFSATNRVMLRTLLQRWSVLKQDQSLPWRETKIANGKALLTWIEKELADSHFYL